METDSKKLISVKDQHLWAKGCPVYIRKVYVYKEEDGSYCLRCEYDSCSEEKVSEFTCSCGIYDMYGRNVQTIEGLTVKDGEASIRGVPEISYAVLNVTEVSGVWKDINSETCEIREPDVVWDSGSLHEALRKAAGKDSRLKYHPRKAAGAWICACGHLNLEKNTKCSGCGTDIRVIFSDSMEDTGSPGSQKNDTEAKTGKSDTVLKDFSDKNRSMLRLVLLSASALILIAAAVILIAVIGVPEFRYMNAVSEYNSGKYQQAAEEFEKLGNYKNSGTMLEKSLRYVYAGMTGLDTDPDGLYITTTEKEPWYGISEDGTLDFKRDKFEGNTLSVPHVIDGIVVRQLSKSCFINCDFESVELPETVTILGEQSFMNCRELKLLKTGTRLSEIGPRTFVNCSSLESFTIPDSVTAMGPRVFNNCTSLRSVYVGKGISELPPYAFSNCAALEEISISGDLTHISEYAFEGCGSLEKVIFPHYSHDIMIDEGNDAFTGNLG
ncbi:MAG: leucine-rich repeat domain-containing protein [Clostridia bacterium]|nr:leucine-rich repeat domain-containing protein [Clostridia bacterium]